MKEREGGPIISSLWSMTICTCLSLTCSSIAAFVYRLIEGMLANGKFSGPRFRHPLSPTVSIPPTLFLGGILVALLATRYGRMWWLGTLLTFTAVSYLSAFIKS